ncbi:MAG: carbohydrate ABC transporter permease [Clostridia bacterium]|nr:carbohydrate ABC transporter permease [Clostridia bacterium]
MAEIKFRKQPLQVKITYIAFLIIFIALAVIHLVPLAWSFLSSLKTGPQYFEDSFGWPKEWHFENYIRVFSEFKYKNFSYFDMLFNSLWYLVVAVTVETFTSALLAYPLARYRFPGRELIYTVVIFANIIPIIGSGPAKFKLMDALGMINNPWTIWISWANAFDFAFIVFYGTFKGISMTYSEAAKMDGASNIRILFQIIFPQAFPSIAAIAITSAINVWNAYSTVMLYLRNYPNLAYGLYLFDGASNYVEDSKPIYFAATIISSIPVIILYAANQKLILSNITAGGLKG